MKNNIPPKDKMLKIHGIGILKELKRMILKDSEMIHNSPLESVYVTLYNQYRIEDCGMSWELLKKHVMLIY